LFNSRVYLSIKSENNVFDPDLLTRELGVTPTKSWRKGDERAKPRPPYTFGAWSFESPAGDEADLDEQRAALVDWLRCARSSLLAVATPHSPVLQYAAYTRRRRSLSLPLRDIDALVDLGIEVDFDLYWPQEPDVAAGVCRNCGLAVPIPLADACEYALGENQGATLRVTLTYTDVSQDEVPPRCIDDDGGCSKVDGLFVSYLRSSRCLVIAAEALTVPHKGAGEAEYLNRVLRELHDHRFVPDRAGRGPPVLSVFLVERGGGQGSSWLSLSLPTLRSVADIGADVSVKLRAAVEPLIQPNGRCWHCELDVLSTAFDPSRSADADGRRRDTHA
jgi:uncharacterized protein DUF4279